MILRNRIQQDLTASLKARDLATTRVLRSLLAAIGNAEAVDTTADPDFGTVGAFASDVERLELNDADVVRIVAAEVAERREAINTYLGVDRSDLAEVMETEIEVLTRYFPI